MPDGGHSRLRILATATAACLLAAPAAGQNAAALASSCASGVPEAGAACADAALAAHALQSGFGLLMGAGGPFPASPSTAGHRLAGSPRWVFDAGVGFARVAVHDLRRSGAPRSKDLWAAPRIAVAAGLLEGISLGPTIGGVGALDVVGELRIVPILDGDAVDGSAAVWGAGVRLGVLRESFTLPGVTASVVHRRAGTLRHGDREAAGEVSLAPSVTSFRAVAGKDLLAFGVSAGVQRDRIRGRARVAGPVGAGESDRLALPLSRTTWFVGVNRTWVVTQAALELGWARAASPHPEISGSSGTAGSGGALAGALTFRVTY